MPEKNVGSDKVNQILDFWFEDRNNPPSSAKERWFKKSPENDEYIKSNFGADVEMASKGEYESWTKEPSSLLALIILLDQFTRNIFRGSAEAFSQDAKALEYSKLSISQCFDKKMSPYERVFLLSSVYALRRIRNAKEVCLSLR